MDPYEYIQLVLNQRGVTIDSGNGFDHFSHTGSCSTVVPPLPFSFKQVCKNILKYLLYNYLKEKGRGGTTVLQLPV